MTATRPVFPKEASGGFYHDLRQRAQTIVAANKTSARSLILTQVVLFPAAVATIYALILLKGDDLRWFFAGNALFGATVTFLVLNLVHDAVHHSLFESAWANRLCAYALDIAGANSFIWGRRHVQLHHTYTNIPGWDVDIEDRTVIRLSPTDPLRRAHRYQHIYLPFLYPFYTLNWVVLRDFRDFFSRTSLVGRVIRIPPAERVKLFIFKAFYALYIIVIPALVLRHPWYVILAGFLVLQGVSSLLTLLIVLPTHFDEHADFPQPDSDGRMHDQWAIHQIKTTNDFSTNRSVVTFLIGALNHHAAHHLFPSVNHAHLPALTGLVAEAAAKEGVQYKSFTFFGALRSHFRLLKRNGVSVSAIFEE
jgi:linoleoyl-CoA desaturase